MLRSVPAAGNHNKLTIAMALLRGLMLVMLNNPVRILFDAWLMRARLVLPLLSRKMRIIGQARRDTALCLPPEIAQSPQIQRIAPASAVSNMCLYQFSTHCNSGSVMQG